MNHLRKPALALCITVIGITAAPTQAASISLPVLVDGYALSDDNFDTISSFVTTSHTLPVYWDGGSEARAALEFDLSALSSPIVSASLVLYFELSDALVGVHAVWPGNAQRPGLTLRFVEFMARASGQKGGGWNGWIGSRCRH